MGRIRGVSSVSALRHPDLHVIRSPCEVKPRTILTIEGLSPDRPLGVHNGDIETLARSLLERMYYCKVGDEFVAPPVVGLADIVDKVGDFGKMLTSGWRATPVSPSDLLDMYRGRKKTIYEAAYQSLCDKPVTSADALIKVFVKCEKVKRDGAPRCIQPRDPRFNFEVGRYIKPIEHRLYRRIAKIYGDGPTVMKGYTVQGVANVIRGKWNSFADPVAVGLDATKFDMHVCENMLKWEHSIYEAIYRDPKLKWLLSLQRRNKGVGRAPDGKLRYKTRGKRASGDMNTALGNCIIMCGLIWAFARERGVSIKLVNNGDDCVVFMERGDLSKFMCNLDAWFLAMGFRMTCEEPVYNLEEIEFCQMKPIPTINGWVMVRNISTALVKDTMCLSNYDENGLRKWMNAVGECGLALCSGVPIMQNFYCAYLRSGLSGGKVDKGMELMSSGLRAMRGDLESKVSEITDQARLGVFVAWGITPDEQIALENHFDAWVLNTGPDIGTTLPQQPIFDVFGLPR